MGTGSVAAPHPHPSIRGRWGAAPCRPGPWECAVKWLPPEGTPLFRRFLGPRWDEAC